MDGNKYAVVWELAKAIAGISIIFYVGDWFGSNKYYPAVNYILVAYFVISLLISGYFSFKKLQEGKQQLQPSI